MWNSTISPRTQVASVNRKWNGIVQKSVLFQGIHDACDNHKRHTFHNGHRSLVTIVSGTEIVKPNALSENTEYNYTKVNETESGKSEIFPTILTAYLSHKW